MCRCDANFNNQVDFVNHTLSRRFRGGKVNLWSGLVRISTYDFRNESGACEMQVLGLPRTREWFRSGMAAFSSARMLRAIAWPIAPKPLVFLPRSTSKPEHNKRTRISHFARLLGDLYVISDDLSSDNPRSVL